MRDRFSRILMAAADNGGGSGGGSGGQEDGGDPDPKMVELVGKIVNQTVHKILTERESRFEKKITAAMNTAIGGKFDEIRQLLVDSGDDKPTPGQDEGPGRQPRNDQQPSRHAQLSPEQTAALKKAQTDAAEARKKAEEWETRAKQEAERNKRAEERQLLSAALGGRVKPALLEMAIDQLHAKHIQRDEETGAILWKDADGTLVPAKDGVTSWMKSDTGKEFLPARDVRGSGGRGGDDIPTRPGSMTLEGLGDIVNTAMARSR